MLIDEKPIHNLISVLLFSDNLSQLFLNFLINVEISQGWKFHYSNERVQLFLVSWRMTFERYWPQIGELLEKSRVDNKNITVVQIKRINFTILSFIS